MKSDRVSPRQLTVSDSHVSVHWRQRLLSTPFGSRPDQSDTSRTERQRREDHNTPTKHRPKQNRATLRTHFAQNNHALGPA